MFGLDNEEITPILLPLYFKQQKTVCEETHILENKVKHNNPYLVYKRLLNQCGYYFCATVIFLRNYNVIVACVLFFKCLNE